MDIRHNGQFYRNSGKTANTQQTFAETTVDIDSVTPSTPSSKILLCAYKELIQHFNQLDTRSKNKWQLEINIIARQLSHLFKQAAKNSTYSGYPALSLLKEIKQLDRQLTVFTKETTENIA